MDIPFSAWHDAIPRRRSIRDYAARAVETADLEAMRRVCAEFRPFASARSVLVADPTEDIFRGIPGGYGKVSGAPALVAFVGDMRSPDVQEAVGYTGEGIILEATALGLATCWVGGFFSPRRAAAIASVAPNERVLAVTPLGYPKEGSSLKERAMSRFGRNWQRRPLSELVSGLGETQWPGWVRAALEAARLAPSAMNRQPWRFRVDRDTITISADSILNPTMVVSKRLDCGIAMLHIEIGALTSGVRGRWELLKSPQVARFRVAVESR
ncbi:MAG: nitroreductase family protein [Dehalococcoidia bacterium]|nr:nitroreductase family protein [Dehalococcoidia bacterium]